MRSYDDNYEFATEDEVLDIISEIPIDLSKENIKVQLYCPSDDKDNVSAVLEKLNGLLNDCEDITLRQEILDNKQQFLRFVKDSICEKFDLGLDVDEDDIDELESITTSLYDALVMHFKKNTIKFFTNYILANKDDLVEEYKGFIDNRDLSGITYKNTMINITVEDYVILVALPLIHKSLYDLTVDVEPIDFLDMSACSRLYSGGILKDYFETGKLCGSFVPSYMGILTGPMENYKQDILETLTQSTIPSKKVYQSKSLIKRLFISILKFFAPLF